MYEGTVVFTVPDLAGSERHRSNLRDGEVDSVLLQDRWYCSPHILKWIFPPPLKQRLCHKVLPMLMLLLGQRPDGC